MLNDYILKKIGNVKTKEAYDELLHGLKVSEAPLETREEAIRELKAQCPQFDEVSKLPSKELFEQLKDGEADIKRYGWFSMSKPKQYDVGIDTFKRMFVNMDKKELMACVRFNIDKYNIRNKGQDESDLIKIIAYAEYGLKVLKKKKMKKSKKK